MLNIIKILLKIASKTHSKEVQWSREIEEREKRGVQSGTVRCGVKGSAFWESSQTMSNKPQGFCWEN